MRIIARTSANAPERKIELPVTEDGSFQLDHPNRWMRDTPSEPLVHFHSLESLNPGSMGGMWDSVLTSGLEAEVVDDIVHVVKHLLLLPYGTAIKAQFFRDDSPSALAFVDWYRRVFP